MSKRVATGPAWQVRQAAQQRLFEEIKQKVIELEETIERPELHWFLLRKFEDELRKPGSSTFPDGTILIVPGWPREHTEMAKKLILEIEHLIAGFQCADAEGNELFAKLFEWTAGEITRPYHSEYRNQETRMLKTLYGAKNDSDEVPYA
ncbi:hypothetical protein KGQ72_03100 [Patescibacteria group bacterium]|nr:hypothetical protein [Patescibacteria group bacterium]MDE2021952.1 hypothetical protein [Patescibacteria group bacterium]